VAADARGRGIGTAPLTAAVALARQQGFGQLRLDVVDTNPRARALYERLGFVALRTQRTPFLRRWLGFGAVTRMEKRL
jgi:ribosomal protein S18 acetylase RimI-like enzyme